ncbi:erythromycin esterase family protein [Chitinophaga sp. 22321]|uniref:Erythromycin esterase family protein n=1 Tax=Chitinophaga hostae TaxID=2831022 RepID=A0ABS5IYZ2_9BACT|nr:erythromycin esterase family protein [Chitinophaga hostae]MBS0028193.1 erythromycin esterase family protein [Chitinophaga hostae]
MRKYLFFILLIAFGKNTTAQEKEVIAYLAEKSIPIHTVAPGDNFDDLQPLGKIWKGKRIIGAGEATHGSKEFTEVRHRLFKFLVTEMGFKTLAIEADYAAVRRVNEYVIYGKGTSLQALEAIGVWIYYTREWLSLLEWMSAFNAGKADADKIRCYGFDMQSERPALQSIAMQLKQFSPGDYAGKFKALETLEFTGKQLEPKDRSTINDLLISVQQYISTHGEKLLDSLGADGYATLRHDLDIVKQCLSQYETSDVYTAVGIRDKSMAANIKWIADQRPGNEGIFVWAHNGHISKDSSLSFLHWMGSYLKQYFGDSYYALGLSFNKGGFRASNYFAVVNFTTGPAEKGSSNELFASVGKPIFFVDIPTASRESKPAENFFQRRIAARNIGGLYVPGNDVPYYLQSPLGQYYDGILFIDEVNAAIPARQQFFGALGYMLDGKKYQGKIIRLTAKAINHHPPDTANLTITKLEANSQRRKFIDILEPAWKDYEIKDTITATTSNIMVTIGVTGQGGKICLDSVQLEVYNKNKWEPITASTAAGDLDDQKSGWRKININAQISIFHDDKNKSHPVICIRND